MKRHLVIVIELIKASTMGLLEYRLDFVSMAAVKVFESAISLILILVLFTQISEIAGWSKYQVLLINLTFTLVHSLSLFFFRYGAKEFSSNLNKGDIDKYLVKPINLQVHASIYGLDWSQIFRIIASIGIIIYIVSIFGERPIFTNVFFYIILVIISVITYYSIAFIFTCTILLGGRIRNITYLTQILWDLGKMPTSIFNTSWQIVFATVFPVWMAATLPVGLFTGKYSSLYVLYGILICVSFVFLSNFILKIALRRYSSASS